MAETRRVMTSLVTKRVMTERITTERGMIGMASTGVYPQSNALVANSVTALMPQM
jgi:hypothetical protein